ncbi:hypothetical protein ACFQLX_18315 [Streptomyces polyrhachis]|uniref:Lipoprotein n=1 Tax=Streptomyces polyrhachis TaxID=1282885 RepID=A0ABW2GHH5_9ACTN
MPIRRTVALLAPLALVAVVSLATGCRSPSDASSRPTTSASPVRQVDGVTLNAGECSTRSRTGFTEIGCTSERAYARVLARHHGERGGGPRCPEVTDFVLDLTKRAAGSVVADPDGYACLRTLVPPHPGDPGGGGGPYTILGDCVYRAEKGRVRETPCDGSGERRPQFRIVKAAGKRAECPKSTALYVTLPGSAPVGCARRV